MIDAKNDLVTHENILKIVTSQEDHYTTGCLLDYNYFKEHDKLNTIDLSKQEALDDVPKALQQINFTGNLERAESTTMFFITEKVKQKNIRFFTRNCESIVSWFCFSTISV